MTKAKLERLPENSCCTLVEAVCSPYPGACLGARGPSCAASQASSWDPCQVGPSACLACLLALVPASSFRSFPCWIHWASCRQVFQASVASAAFASAASFASAGAAASAFFKWNLIGRRNSTEDLQQHLGVKFEKAKESWQVNFGFRFSNIETSSRSYYQCSWMQSKS